MEDRLIVKECEGCSKVVEVPFPGTEALLNICSVYPNPAVFWSRGGCFFNAKVEVKETRKRVGQQKQTKAA